MGKKLLLIGGGGHAHSVIDSLYLLDEFKEIGIVVNDLPVGHEICGIRVVGNDDDLDKLKREGYNYAFVTIGSIGDTRLRQKLTDLLIQKDFMIPNITDYTAIVSPLASVGFGNFIGKNAIINANVVIGDNSIINTATVIEHDCVIGDYVHLSPGSVLSGGVRVGDDSHIGANSSIKHGISIGSNTLIGLGSVVVKDISDNVVAYGNPCREVRNK